MDARLVVDGLETPLSPKETKLLLKSLSDYRSTLRHKRSKQEEFDRECYALKRDGWSDADIGKTMGVSARRVRGAIMRIECGRYG